MCGICGVIGYKEEVSRKEETLTRMMEAIRHRGPDGRDRYIAQDVMLGFQRLSIIDEKTGMQPMWNEDKSIVLVFNGEIYNFKALRRELEKRGHIFSSKSDSEVLIHGYEEYHEGLLEKLRGMFSFAIWDVKRKVLFAARDDFGIKPFYYTQVGDTFVFASEIKSILKFPGVQKIMNEAALEQYLSFQYSVLPETFFKGIYQLKPGHYLEYKNHELKLHRYYEAVLKPREQGSWMDMYVDIRESIVTSVKKHLVSDVEVGCFLSGGVDSSLIAAMAGCQKTFTVGFADEGKRYDETMYARELAEHMGVENHCRYIKRDEFLKELPKVMYYLDEPLGDASAIAFYFLTREAAGKVKVVLSGEGADEVFGGYNIYLEPKALRYMYWIPKKVRRILAQIAKRLPKHMKGRNYVIRAAQDLRERYIGNAYIFHEEEKEKLLLRKSSVMGTQKLLWEEYSGLGHLKDLEQMQAIDLKYWLPGDILQKADKMSMAHSLELRVPFLDREVFRVASRIPHKIKTKNYTTKYALRRVASLYLPKEVAGRKKLGFPVPIRKWLREEEWYQRVKKEFTGEIAAYYFERDYLMELLDEHKAGACDNSRKIWTVYVFLVWYHVFFGEDEKNSGGRKFGDEYNGRTPVTCNRR